MYNSVKAVSAPVQTTRGARAGVQGVRLREIGAVHNTGPIVRDELALGYGCHHARTPGVRKIRGEQVTGRFYRIGARLGVVPRLLEVRGLVALPEESASVGRDVGGELEEGGTLRYERDKRAPALHRARRFCTTRVQAARPVAAPVSRETAAAAAANRCRMIVSPGQSGSEARHHQPTWAPHRRATPCVGRRQGQRQNDRRAHAARLAAWQMAPAILVDCARARAQQWLTPLARQLGATAQTRRAAPDRQAS